MEFFMFSRGFGSYDWIALAGLRLWRMQVDGVEEVKIEFVWFVFAKTDSSQIDFRILVLASDQRLREIGSTICQSMQVVGEGETSIFVCHHHLRERAIISGSWLQNKQAERFRDQICSLQLSVGEPLSLLIGASLAEKEATSAGERDTKQSYSHCCFVAAERRLR